MSVGNAVRSVGRQRKGRHGAVALPRACGMRRKHMFRIMKRIFT